LKSWVAIAFNASDKCKHFVGQSRHKKVWEYLHHHIIYLSRLVDHIRRLYKLLLKPWKMQRYFVSFQSLLNILIFFLGINKCMLLLLSVVLTDYVVASHSFPCPTCKLCYICSIQKLPSGAIYLLTKSLLLITGMVYFFIWGSTDFFHLGLKLFLICCYLRLNIKLFLC